MRTPPRGGREAPRRSSGNPKCRITKWCALLEAAFDSRTIMRRGRSSAGAYGRLRGPERAPGQDLDGRRGRRGDRRPRADPHPGERRAGRPRAAPDGMAGHPGTAPPGRADHGTLRHGLPGTVAEVRAQGCPRGSGEAERHAARDGGVRAADAIRSPAGEQDALRRPGQAEEPHTEPDTLHGALRAGCADLRRVHSRAVGHWDRAAHGAGRGGDAHTGAGARHRPDARRAAPADTRDLPVTRR